MKHSIWEETIRTGIKETLEHLTFLPINENYVFGRNTSDDSDVFGSGWNGLLVIQALDQETPSVDTQEDVPITILQVEELNEKLPDVLGNILNQ